MEHLSLMQRVERDYWPECGHRWLDTTPHGHLTVTDDFLRHLLERPELAPVAESCEAEHALHGRLSLAPRSAVTDAELSALADPDASANYAVWLRFRDRLLAHPTLEASYIGFFQGQGVDVPPVLVHQITQVLLRQALGSSASPFEARAAEMLFRPQKISILEGPTVMAADDETVERHALSGGFGSLGELLKQGGAPLRSVDLDVLGPDNGDLYWERCEAFDFAVSLNRGQPTLDALCRVLERWVTHFLGVEVRIRPESEIQDERWVWHVGLDAEASAVLNALYNGDTVEPGRMERLLCLFQLEFVDPADMRREIAGRPVYLAMAMDAQNRLRLKPQNLLLNLPLAPRN